MKEEHQHLASMFHPLPIPEWKWEIMTLDFITGLPKSKRQNESIMVAMDKLIKVAHYILVQSMYKIV